MRAHFVPYEVALSVQKELINQYGGKAGIRDLELLKSALAQPQATFGGKFLHKTIFDKAAAYGYHLCMNHPFIDGNKRMALVLMDIFLQKNGREIVASEKEAYMIIMQLADGNITKNELADWLKNNTSNFSG